MVKARFQKMYTEKYKQDMGFVIIGERYIGPFIDMYTAQKAVDAINSQFAQQTKRTRTEYEKVTESIFDLRDEFERGELVSKVGEKVAKLESEKHFVTQYSFGYIHRKIEKEIDWREDADSYFLKTKYLGIDCTIEEAITRSDYCDEFLELCRVALRANGEIEL